MNNGKLIHFESADKQCWNVLNTQEKIVGKIEFYSHWHQFVFLPLDGVKWDITALHDVCEFMRHRAADLSKKRERKG